MSNPAPITPINQAAPKSLEIKERLVARRATLKADLEYMQGEVEAIDSQLLDILGGEVGTHDIAGTKVQVREYSRLDTKWIEAEYPAEQYPQLYKTTTAVDNAAVKKQFAPGVLEEHQVRGAKSLVVK
ncbi:hypothetical protein [Microbacterium sp. Root280D1]|uniref:hypothetical protein n=1 Tax=Microbacterium sp. Root280D1 TaxID=1736510 RepID=UPI0006FF072F|nr:hypothetical protein [Microbacterium sp. Root280D1]KRD51937.1 hypothetical protein ASE34_08450 [Microbacterium sp. Root280D1]